MSAAPQLVAVLALAAAWLAIGAAGLAALHRFHFVARVLFPAGGVVALLLAAAALPALWGTPQAAVLPIGLPGLPFHFRLDGLSAFFLVVLGATAAGVSLFSAGYFRQSEGTAPGLLCLQYHVFLAAMALVVADRAQLGRIDALALHHFIRRALQAPPPAIPPSIRAPFTRPL